MKRPAAEVEALRPALAAFERGTKRSRLRIMSVVCLEGHTLLEVFPTAAGPVAVWKARETFSLGAAGGSAHRPRDIWYAEELESPYGGMSVGAVGACRCIKVVSVEPEWVLEQLAAGRTRVVASEMDDSPESEPDWFA